MSLSKRARRGIQAFNMAKNPLYSAQHIVLDTKTDAYVEAYLQALEGSIDDTLNGQVGEMAGQSLSGQGGSDAAAV